MKFDQQGQPHPHVSILPLFSRRAITISVIGMVLTLALMIAGMVGFDGPTYNAPWCTYTNGTYGVSTGVGLMIFSITGFAFLLVSIISALLVLGRTNTRKKGAIVCLVISIIGLPLFGFYCFIAAFACAG